jgi:pantoate--beta-alanine ligase
MKIVTRVAEMAAAAKETKSQGRTVGFVPTMGFLHEGHLSLVKESKRSADITVVSIFVNPLQFGPKEDFRRYPRDLARDAEVLKKEGVDILFNPDVREMYPEFFKTTVEVSELQDALCGRSRPGHFKGVCTVVLKLIHIVRPDLAFFGQKDAQQAIILQKMVDDLNMDVSIRIMPIVRNPDGLALSSRNTYLSDQERRAALVLSKSLAEARRMFEDGERNSAMIVGRMRGMIKNEPLARIDYVEVVDLKELRPLERIDGRALVALAVFIGKVRLIDNVILETEGNAHE